MGPKEMLVVLKQFVSFRGATAEGRAKMTSTHYEPAPLVSFHFLLAIHLFPRPLHLTCKGLI
jgi:hypothetical protein